MKIFLIAVLFCCYFFLGGNLANAQESMATAEASTSSASEVSSYILFWPLTAGKTESNSFYFLKLFREQLRGWFNFDDNKKADYAIFLGTKRVLEAEKLLKTGKIDLALKALERADAEFTSAYSHIKAAASKGKLSAGEIRRDRLIYVKRLIDYLKITAPSEAQPGLDGVKDRADAILRDYLP